MENNIEDAANLTLDEAAKLLKVAFDSGQHFRATITAGTKPGPAAHTPDGTFPGVELDGTFCITIETDQKPNPHRPLFSQMIRTKGE